jgi:protein TonB
MHTMLDARGPRALVCVLAAVSIWIGFSAGFVRGLWNADDKANTTKQPAVLDVRLVRLPPDEPHRTSPQSGARVPETAARTTPAPATPAAAAKPARPMLHRIAPAPAAPSRNVSRPAAAPVATPSLVEGNERAQPVAPPTATATANPAQPAAAASASSNTLQPNGPARSAATATATSSSDRASTSTGNGPAHAILQPLPSLPDDLREDAFQAVATARFSVHRDGSVDVELIKPTHNPRLNQLLVDALKKWRFFPAMKNGEAVESTQDIRVHFNVD